MNYKQALKANRIRDSGNAKISIGNVMNKFSTSFMTCAGDLSERYRHRRADLRQKDSRTR